MKPNMKYLPPINNKVAKFSTIMMYMKYSKFLTDFVNMPDVNITLDRETKINAYKLIWN